jgi:hypothetical protein
MFPREDDLRNTDLQEAWLRKNAVLPTEKKTDVAIQPGSFAYDMKPLFQLYRLVGNFPVHVKHSGNIEQTADRLCGLVVTVPGYRSRDPGSIPGTTKKKVVCLEWAPLSLVSTTEELLDRKVAAPV